MRKITVHLGPRSYPVRIGHGSLKDLALRLTRTLPERERWLLTTRAVRRHCLSKIARYLPRSLKTIEIPDGERFKNLQTVERLYQTLLKQRAGRKGLLILMGGGVTGDLGGYVAATYLRGIPYIHVPTTLLAQIDSSIGGKVGVNLGAGKNLVGAFYQPVSVLTDLSFLQTLPPREFRAGLGEAIKYGFMKDPKILQILERGENLPRDPENLEDLVTRCVRIKARIVEQDEREEKGIRRILNLGHTFGHALERLTGYRRYLHGEAVAIGLVATARISNQLGYCSRTLVSQVEDLLKKIGLPTEPPRFSRDQWLRAIQVDKKGEGTKIHFVFLKGLGEMTVQAVDPREILC